MLLSFYYAKVHYSSLCLALQSGQYPHRGSFSKSAKGIGSPHSLQYVTGNVRQALYWFLPTVLFCIGNVTSGKSLQ